MADNPRLLFHDSSPGAVKDKDIGGNVVRDTSPLTADLIQGLTSTVNRAAQGALGSDYNESDMDTLQKTIVALVLANETYKKFGLGGPGKIVSDDLNNITQSGFYYADTNCSNKPNKNNGFVFVCQYLNSDYAAQLCIDLNSDIYYRIRVRGSWAANWTQIAVKS